MWMCTVPVGLDPPVLELLNATSLRVQWSPPTSSNGIIVTYDLIVSSSMSVVSINQGLATSTLLHNLTPFTLYQISVNVTNTEGSLVSEPSNITTGETGIYLVIDILGLCVHSFTE